MYHCVEIETEVFTEKCLSYVRTPVLLSTCIPSWSKTTEDVENQETNIKRFHKHSQMSQTFETSKTEQWKACKKETKEKNMKQKNNKKKNKDNQWKQIMLIERHLKQPWSL